MVYHMFSLYFDFLSVVVISHFGFEGGTLNLIASVPGQWLHFTFHNRNCRCWNVFEPIMYTPKMSISITVKSIHNVFSHNIYPHNVSSKTVCSNDNVYSQNGLSHYVYPITNIPKCVHP